MTKSKLTFDEHLDKAMTIRMINTTLRNLHVEFSRKFGNTHKITRKVQATRANFESVKSGLDSEYHKVCGDENFSKYGHIYYGDHDLPAVQSEPGNKQGSAIKR
jgi:hypothetical protein